MDESTHPTTSRAHDPMPDPQRSAPSRGRARSALPWIIAAVAVLAAVIAIGAFAVNEANEPRSVARLAAQPDAPEGTFSVDAETTEIWGVTAADFVPHGSYGVLDLWSTMTPEDLRCLAVVAEGRVSVLNCTAPTIDTIADFNIGSHLVPRAPSGEPASHVRFVLHDDVVDVYLAPKPGGGYY